MTAPMRRRRMRSPSRTPPDTQVRNLLRQRMRLQPLSQLPFEEIGHDSPASASAARSFARALAV